jgi:hypothetical protein
MSNSKPSPKTSTARQLRIRELSQEITSLTKELDGLLIQELSDTAEADLNIGDIVSITNNQPPWITGCKRKNSEEAFKETSYSQVTKWHRCPKSKEKSNKISR